MVWEGLDIAEACRDANLKADSMRKALCKPHVLAYMRAQREVLRASMSGRNILTLAEVRDQTGNAMARVAAVKALEQLGDDPNKPTGNASVPGLVVVIGSSLMPHERAIEAKPLKSLNAGPIDDGTY